MKSLILTGTMILLSLISISQVTFYKHRDYDGNNLGYSGECEEKQLGEQGPWIEDFIGTGCKVCNDQISSLKVSPGWAVTVYEHKDFTGRSRTFTSDCAYVGDDWNDIITSFKIYRYGPPPPQLMAKYKDGTVFIKNSSSSQLYLFKLVYIPFGSPVSIKCNGENTQPIVMYSGMIHPINIPGGSALRYEVYTKNDCDLRFIKASGTIAVGKAVGQFITIAP